MAPAARASAAPCSPRRHTIRPDFRALVTGRSLRTWPDERLTIEAVLPRRTAVVRASAGAEALGQILVANVDTVAVVVPVDPEPDLGLVERLLCLAWESGARPVVALTKVDLAAHPEILVEEVGEIAPGVEVFGVSAATGPGLERAARPGECGTYARVARSVRLGQVHSRQCARRGDGDADPTHPPRRWSRPAHDHPSRPDPAPWWRCGDRHSGDPRGRVVRRNRRTRPYVRRHRRARGPVPVRRLYARTRARLCGASRSRRWGAEPAPDGALAQTPARDRARTAPA